MNFTFTSLASNKARVGNVATDDIIAHELINILRSFYGYILFSLKFILFCLPFDPFGTRIYQWR